jgi:hypothetical protein
MCSASSASSPASERRLRKPGQVRSEFGGPLRWWRSNCPVDERRGSAVLPAVLRLRYNDVGVITHADSDDVGV